MTASLAALLALTGGIALGWAVRGLYEAHSRRKVAQIAWAALRKAQERKQASRVIHKQAHAPEVKAQERADALSKLAQLDADLIMENKKETDNG